jgi:hypothetical protein
VTALDARHILKNAAHILFEAGDERIAPEPGAISARHSVLIDVTAPAFEIRKDYGSHEG